MESKQGLKFVHCIFFTRFLRSWKFEKLEVEKVGGLKNER